MLCIPPGAEGKCAMLAALADLKPGLAALLATPGPAGSRSRRRQQQLGARTAERTATGRPLLAGDPHRVLEMPNMYAQAHLACDEFDVIGLTVPGAPGFPEFRP